MDLAWLSSPNFLKALLRAELILTFNIIVGVLTGELILSLGIVEKLFKPIVPRLLRWGIHQKIAGALLLAIASSRSAAALISASYTEGEITREEATFGTLSLAFPGYLRRWVGTVAIATSIAGSAGLIYAVVLIVRSAVRFIWVINMLRRHGMACGVAGIPSAQTGETSIPVSNPLMRRKRLLGMLKRSLPWAWAFFALTYALIPFIERVFTDHIAHLGLYSFLPPQGWAVAVSALAHATAALSSAGGALATGELGVGQAVLALLVGNMVGTITRTMRQNVGYWMGIFPKELITGLLRWHLTTLLSLEIVSILIAWFVIL